MCRSFCFWQMGKSTCNLLVNAISGKLNLFNVLLLSCCLTLKCWKSHYTSQVFKRKSLKLFTEVIHFLKFKGKTKIVLCNSFSEVFGYAKTLILYYAH